MLSTYHPSLNLRYGSGLYNTLSQRGLGLVLLIFTHLAPVWFLRFPLSFVSDLYGVHVRPVAPFGSTSSKPQFDPALIHRSLPDELLFEVGAFPYLFFLAAEVGSWIYIYIYICCYFFVGVCSDVALWPWQSSLCLQKVEVHCSQPCLLA